MRLVKTDSPIKVITISENFSLSSLSSIHLSDPTMIGSDGDFYLSQNLLEARQTVIDGDLFYILFLIFGRHFNFNEILF